MSRWILFAHNGLEYGPVEEKGLVSWIKERRISADDLVKAEGFKEWRLVGEKGLFDAYFKDKPARAGEIKKVLKNEVEKLKGLLERYEEKLEKNKEEATKNAITSSEIKDSFPSRNCEGCSFIETVERLHEEKKVLEEKLAGERSRLRHVRNGGKHG